MPPAKRKFRPGHRDNPQLRGSGKMSENRFAWLRTVIGQFTIMKYEPSEEDADAEYGPTVLLYIPRPGGRDISFNLTALTKEELDAIEEFFNLLIAEARPVVADRDRIANEALEAGDDSHARVYRQVPQFIVRKRSKRQDNQGVHDGSQDVSPRDGRDGNLDDGVRRVGNELVDSESSEAGSEDDGSSTH